MMTEERKNAIMEYLTEDEERSNELFKLDVEEAAKKIKADGYDFTAEELREFAETVSKSNVNVGADGELDVDSLDNVSGGSLVAAFVLGGITGWCLGQKVFGRR